MWGLIPAQSSSGSDSYRQALHKKGSDYPPPPALESGADLDKSLLSLDDLLPGGKVDILLVRSSFGLEWGFTVEEESEKSENYNLVVKNVTRGSIADGQQLMRGDVITAVNGCDVTTMSHSKAEQLLKDAGLQLTLTIDPQPIQSFPVTLPPQNNGHSHMVEPSTHLYDPPRVQPSARSTVQAAPALYQDDWGRSKSAERLSRGAESGSYQEYESSNQRSKSSFRFGSQSTLIEPGWKARSNPQPVARAMAYPGANEMGWTPRPKGGAKKVYSNSSFEMGWSPQPKQDRASAFTRVNNHTAKSSSQQNTSRRQRQQQPSHYSDEQQYNTQPYEQHYATNRQQAVQQQQSYEQHDDETTRISSNTNLVTYSQPDNVQHVQHSAGQKEENNNNEATNQYDNRQQEQHQQPRPSRRQQQEQYVQGLQEKYEINSPYEESDYKPRRAQRRSHIMEDQDFSQGMPAWYGSLRPAGGRYGRQKPDLKRQSSDPEPPSNWVPHGLDRETRMIEAQAAYVASIPYYPPARAQQPVTSQQKASVQPQQAAAKSELHVGGQQYQQQQTAAGQQINKSQYQQEQLNEAEPHWTAYPKKWTSNPPQQQQRGEGRRPGDGKGEKFKSSIQNIHLVNTTWTTPGEGIQSADLLHESQGYGREEPWPVDPVKQEQTLNSAVSRLAQQGQSIINIESLKKSTQQIQQVRQAEVHRGTQQQQAGQAQIPSGTQQVQQAGQAQIQRGTQQLQQAGQVDIQRSNVPKQFYREEDHVVSQMAPDVIEAVKSRTISSAFIDFYVIEHTGVRQQPSNAPLQLAQNRPEKKIHGGFENFYVIAEMTPADKAALNKSEPQQKQKQEVQSSESKSTGAQKTRTGGFIDFYVVPQGASPSPRSATQAPAAQPTAKPAENDIKPAPKAADTNTAVKHTENAAAPAQPSTQEAAKANEKQVNKTADADKTQKPSEPQPTAKIVEAKKSVTENSVKTDQVAAKVVNGKPDQTKAAPGQAGKDGPQAPGQAGKGKDAPQAPGAAKAQKLSTPLAFRDQLKPSKALPGKLK